MTSTPIKKLFCIEKVIKSLMEESDNSLNIRWVFASFFYRLIYSGKAFKNISSNELAFYDKKYNREFLRVSVDAKYVNFKINSNLESEDTESSETIRFLHDQIKEKFQSVGEVIQNYASRSLHYLMAWDKLQKRKSVSVTPKEDMAVAKEMEAIVAEYANKTKQVIKMPLYQLAKA